MEEITAEMLVRQSVELNKVDPRFKPGLLEYLVETAEQDRISWLLAVKIIDLGLIMSGLLVFPEESGDEDPVIDPAAYQLAI